jgi:hypothetical protein
MINKRFHVSDNYSVPEQLFPFLGSFVSRGEREIKLLKTFLITRDFEAILDLTKKIEEQGEVYGFPQLLDLANDLESAALICDPQRSREDIEHLEQVIQGIRRHLN